MNTKVKLMVIFSVIVMVVFSSCKKDDDSADDSYRNSVQQALQSDSWVITYFNDSGENETNYFAGYRFTFDDSGVIEATNGTNQYSGTWSLDSSSSDDDSSDELELHIYFNTTDSFEELNDDWDILSQSNEKIELIDVSGGNGGTDYLTFEKD